MAIPKFNELLLPVLRASGDGMEHRERDLISQLADALRLSAEDRTELLPSGGSRFGNRVGWAITYLKKAVSPTRAAAFFRTRPPDSTRPFSASTPASRSG